jgi:hypothetical protein
LSSPPESAPIAKLGRGRQALLITAGAFVLAAAGVSIGMAFIHRDDLVDVPPAHTVAGAYWTAVQRKSLAAIRRLLCDDDRVMLGSVDDRTLSRRMFPPGREVLGYTIAGEQDKSGATVVVVQVVRKEAGRVSTVTRQTPVVEKNGMFTVCFHSVGLYPAS